MVKPQLHICDVCKLIDKDETLKFCTFCPVCNAWICTKDRNRLDRRAQAMALRAIGK